MIDYGEGNFRFGGTRHLPFLSGGGEGRREKGREEERKSEGEERKKKKGRERRSLQ